MSVNQGDEIREIDAAAAKLALEKGEAAFVDIRDPDSYELSHIPGALHLNNENVEAFLKSFDKEQPLIVYCYHGHSSLNAVAHLQQNGFKDVRSLSGGFEGW